MAHAHESTAAFQQPLLLLVKSPLFLMELEEVFAVDRRRVGNRGREADMRFREKGKEGLEHGKGGRACSLRGKEK